jgi:diguanylate cyclase (GGDEF)-like protein
MEPAVPTGATEKPDASAADKDRRLRAVYRRQLQDSVLFSALAATAGIAVTTVIAGLVAPNAAPAEILVATPIVLPGLGVARTIPRRFRRYVVQLGMLVGLLPFFSTATTTVLVPGSEPLSLGALGVLPLAFAVYVPLERKQHLIWLILAGAIFFRVVMTRSGPAVWSGEMPAMAFTAALAFGLSLGANEIQLRRRQQMNRQLLAMRGLYGRMKEHELDLRRQNEFLSMLQETLVVQQAELLRLNEELETIARLDALTGLGNRLRLNDTMGHLAGDAALRGVAAVLRKTSRVGDGLYRYGGEEFLVVLHDCDENALAAAGQRYISAVAAAGMAHPDNPPWNLVTSSAGARELSQRNCADIDAVLHDADEALYVAKTLGRNRLEIHPGPPAGSIVPINRQRAAS